MSEHSEFESQFCQEELELLAMTGASGFGGGKAPKHKYWTASIDLEAWKKPGEPMETGIKLLSMLADDKQLEKLRKHAKPDSVIRAKVRCSLDGRRFMLTDTPTAAKDPELEAYLAERLKPVYYQDKDLGKFSLERTVDWFEKEIDWLGEKINLSFDKGEPEEMESCLKTAKDLLSSQKEWDAKVRNRAVEDLLELKNDSWLDDDQEDVTAEEFSAVIGPDSLSVMPDGEFEFWFHDGDLFWGHSIRIEGTLDDGPSEAHIEG